MNNFQSVLTLQKTAFDKLEFKRKGFKTTNELNYTLQVQFGVSKENDYRVTLVLTGDKKDEYEFLISLSGIFHLENNGDTTEEVKKELLRKNTVAILMPYLRSEVTLLTAQPETDSVVLPVFNINKLFDNDDLKK
jgi:preprotein translocase subunit SecB